MLTMRGIPVAHILGVKRARPHVLKSWARVGGTRLTYPPADGEAGEEVPGGWPGVAHTARRPIPRTQP